MNKTEKIILLIAVIVYLLAFVDFGAVEFVYDFFFNLTNIILCFMYLLGGYFLFKLPKKYILLSVFSGIAFGLCFISNIYGFSLQRNYITEIFPIPNLILLFGFVITCIVFKIQKIDFLDFRLLALRSLVIGIITSFLSYMPVSLKLCRTIMYGLNNGNEYIQYNLKAHDYVFDSEKYSKEKDCDNAILSAEKALEFGIKWLDKDYDYFNNQINSFIENNDFSDQAKKDFLHSIFWLTNDYDFVRIQGIMEKLFEAYYCKSDDNIRSKDYGSAVKNLEKALVYLDLSEIKYNYWKQQKVYALSDLAVAYGKIGDFEKADLLFFTALEEYDKIKNKHEFSKGTMLRDWGIMYKDYSDYESAITLYEKALQVFEENSDDVNFYKEVCLIRELLANSYLALGNYEQVKFNLHKALSFFDSKKLNKEENDSYQTLVFSKGLYYYAIESYQESIDVLNENINLLSSKNLKSNYYLCLSWNYLALSDFKNTEESIEKGLKLTAKNTRTEADLLSFYASLNEIKSEYKKSKDNYQKALSIYENLDEENRITSVLFGLSKVEITIFDYQKSKEHFNRAEKLYQEQEYGFSPRNASVHNLSAYLNYCFEKYSVSDTIYTNVLKSNKRLGKENSVSSAVALNGLGLVKSNTKTYQQAEELFIKSILIYEDKFKSDDYSLGVVYLNYANLLIETNQLDKAQLYLSKSEQIFKKYFDDSHDCFGNLYLAFGDFYKKKKEYFLAKENYQKALKIYSDKFDENHHKVTLVKQKIK